MSNNMQWFFIPWRLPGMNEIIAGAKNTYKVKGTRVGDGYSKLKSMTTLKILSVIAMEQIKPVKAARFEFIWKEKNKRRDPDNIAAAIKFILDSLVKAKIIDNDGWKYNLGWTNKFKVDSSEGVEVRIYEINQLDEQIRLL